MSPRTVLGLILVLLPCACVAKSAGETFEFDAPFERVDIEVATGSVTVVGHDGEGATVETTSHWRGSRQPDLDVAIEGETLVLRVDCGALSTCSVDAKLRVPRAVEFSMTGTTGDLVIRDFDGKVDAELTTGTISLTSVTGELQVGTTTGDVRGTELGSKKVVAETTTGSVALAFVDGAQDVEAEATTGRIDLELPAGTYAIDAVTTTGDVSIDVEHDAAAKRRVVANTTTGSITVRPG